LEAPIENRAEKFVGKWVFFTTFRQKQYSLSSAQMHKSAIGIATERRQNSHSTTCSKRVRLH